MCLSISVATSFWYKRCWTQKRISSYKHPTVTFQFKVQKIVWFWYFCSLLSRTVNSRESMAFRTQDLGVIPGHLSAQCCILGCPCLSVDHNRKHIHSHSHVCRPCCSSKAGRAESTQILRSHRKQCNRKRRLLRQGLLNFHRLRNKPDSDLHDASPLSKVLTDKMACLVQHAHIQGWDLK